MKAQMWNRREWITETDPKKLKDKYQALLIESGFRIENFIEKYFEPYGYTALWLLSESHFAIHTFPEENKTYIEISSCVKKQFDRFINREKSAICQTLKT